MNSAIALLRTKEPHSTLDELERQLTSGGFMVQIYHLDELDELQNALKSGHWLAIAEESVSREAIELYTTNTLGGFIQATASPDFEHSRRAFKTYRALDYLPLVNIQTVMDDLELSIQKATMVMHLPTDFFKNPDSYCNGCLEILALRWKGSRAMLGGNSPMGYELSAYDWGLVGGTTAEIFLNTGRYAINTTLQHLVRPFGVACNEHGLKPEHHGFLNGIVDETLDEKRVIFGRFRRMYKDNPLALEEIDGYDGESLHAQHLRLYRNALRSGDKTAEKREQRWSGKNYPLTTPAYLRR